MKITCADAITMMAGKLLVDIGRLYELYNFLLNDNLMTHQLPQAKRKTDAYLRESLPAVAAYIDTAEYDKSKYKEYLANGVAILGDEFHIESMPNPPYIQLVTEEIMDSGTMVVVI